VLGPAGMGMFALVGSLLKYENELKNIKEISGSSAGAIIGVAIALGIPLRDILDKLLSIDFENLAKFKLKSFISTYGFINIEPLRKVMIHAYGSNPTFSELPMKVYIAAYCVNRSRTEYFSVDSHPNMKVVDAVCMSIAIPFVISAVKYKGMLYTDGSTRELYPLTPFIDKNPEKIICFKLKSKEIFIENISNIKQYICGMLSSVVQLPDTNRIKLGKLIQIDMDIDYCYKWNMTHEDKLRLYVKGLSS